jgi:flagellar motor protein MotB
MRSSMSKTLARAAVVLLVAAGAGGCSTVSDVLDSANPFGDSDSQEASQPPADDTASASASQPAADTGTTPNLADIPDKPAPPSTDAERKQVADALVADRARAQYSTDALRGGTEAAAAPPPPAPPPGQVASVTPSASPSADTTSSDQTVDASPAAATPAPAPTTPVMTASTAPVPSTASGPNAPAGPAPGALPAVPAVPGSVPGLPMTMSDTALGFQRSTAAPLDASVSQFVAPSIIARYQQTATMAAAPGVVPTPPYRSGPAVALSAPAGTRPAVLGTNMTDVGGPETMSGSVIANFDALQAAPPATQASVYASAQGLPPAAVVFFPNDTTVLNEEAKAKVRDAVEAFKANGGNGFVRVVGHSSSRTANMSLQRHLVFNFERSQARATAVAKELIREGVPASKVLVEAVGDSQPVYYESMPEGEEGNRRAEIFFQS